MICYSVIQLFSYSKMNDTDFKKIFITHRGDVSDEGFSDRVMRQLPERKSVLPQMVMVVSIMIGLALTFAIQGVTPMIGLINSLITSISHLQAPSPGSVIAYLGVLTLVGIIGYSVTQVDAG